MTHFLLRDAMLARYARNSDILSSKGTRSESRDLFNCLEISDNISLTVQDRDVVATEH